MLTMRSFKLLCAALVLVASAAVTSVVAAPQFQSREVHNRRACGTYISSSKKAAAEKRFSQHRLPASDPNAKATIDVYMNVVYANKTREGGYLPKEALVEQITVMNDAYSKTGVSFKMVNITRIKSPEWFARVAPGSPEEQQMKKTFRRGGPAELNMYTVGFQEGDAAGLLGYATFPSDYTEATSHDDGVVLLHTSFPGGPKEPYNRGITAVHEGGHWAGLYHTFQDGCDGKGDMVEDTPAQREATYGCPTPANSCSPDKADPVSNYMNYSDDACLSEFTEGQIRRLRAEMATFRKVKFA